MTAPTPAAQRTVPTRRVSFDESLAGLPKHFAGDGDLIGSHLMACLSAVFPDGEDFFVRSVRNLRNKVADPELKRQVAGFIGQEAVHGREHRAFNARLAELGYPTREIEFFIRNSLALRERFLPDVSNLAATAALEHFTATFAEVLLTSEEAREMCGEPAVRDLFVWHALEESEHKAVAFDVYKAVGGSERLRTFTMNALTIGFLGSMAFSVTTSLLRDRAFYRPRALRSSWKRFRGSAFVRPEVWHQLRDYNRRDFHPDDRDTSALVERWRDELFGAEGRLNDKLAGAEVAA